MLPQSVHQQSVIKAPQHGYQLDNGLHSAVTKRKNQIWQKLTNIMLMFGLELRAKFVWFILLRQDTTCK